jgi:signal transduction histidine kinase
VDRRRVAWLAAGVSALLVVVDTALVVASYPPMSVRSTGIHGWPLVNLAGLGSAVLGAVIVGANPRQPIGWILNLIGLTTSISLAAESYSIWVLQYDGEGSSAMGHLAGWVAAVLGGPLALACLTWAFLLVPTGTYLSSRWAWVARVTWAAYCMYVLGLVLVGPYGVNRNGDPIDASVIEQILLSGGVLVITAMILTSVVAMLRRLRGSTGATRQQLRLVTIGAAGVGAALVILIIGQSLNEGRQSGWTSVPLYLSYVLLVVCIAVAVLRYRLYEVEVIVSRALALAIATAFVAIAYVGLVVVLGRTVEDRIGGGLWWSLLATVVVALAFQPLRRRVLAVADRLAYGDRAAPYDALADFSGRIGRTPATDELLPTIAAASGEAVHAQRAVVRLVGEGGVGQTATWPATSGSDGGVPDGGVVVPIEDASGPLGSVVLTLPPGRDIRPTERRLLADIAEQAALALRNARLELEVAERVRQLDRHTRELTASRNRIIGAVDTERRRLESAIAVRVLPTMLLLRSQVARSATAEAQADSIEESVGLATKALESLRELTRGIYPTMLTRSGLGSALSSHAARVGRSDALRIDPDLADARFPEHVEAAVYSCCVEVLEHVGGEIVLGLDDTTGELVVSIAGVRLEDLNELAILDRVQACGGVLGATCPDGVTWMRFSLLAADPTTPAAGVRG